MKEQKEVSEVVRPSVLSFGAAREIAREQIKAEYFDEGETEWLRAIHNVMADVYMQRTDLTMRVEGEEKEAGQVQEIFRTLTVDHVRQVMRRAKTLSADRIVSVKKYLRTALYNAALCGEAEEEIDAEWMWRNVGSI